MSSEAPPAQQQEQQKHDVEDVTPASLQQEESFVEDPYFRQLSFEGVFGQVLHVFRQRYTVFIGITLLTYLAGWVFALIAAYLLGADLQIDGFSVKVSVNMNNLQQQNSNYTNYNNGGGNDYDYDQSPNMQMWQIFLYWIECVIYYCFLCIAHGGSVWLAAHLYLHQYPTLTDAFRQALKFAYPLIASLALIGLMVSIPVFLVALLIAYFGNQNIMMVASFGFVAYVIFLQIVFYHVYPSIMVEKLGAVESLKRSFYLTENHRCFLLGVLLCWAVVRFVIGLVIASIGVTAEFYSWQWYLSKALDTLFGILFASLESV